jgi:hypothetical protein
MLRAERMFGIGGQVVFAEGQLATDGAVHGGICDN